MHDRLRVVEANVADQSPGEHLRFIHVLQQVLQIVDHWAQVVLAKEWWRMIQPLVHSYIATLFNL